MKTVKRTMYFPKFSEKCNDFSYEERTFERPMTAQERKVNLIDTLINCISFSIILLSLALFIIAVGGNFQTLGFVSLVFCVAFMAIAVLYEIYAKKKIYPIIERMGDIGFDAEVLQWEQITQEENDKAAKWREAHPLEEAIRKAQQTKNCNDIAALLKLYQSGDLKQ